MAPGTTMGKDDLEKFLAARGTKKCWKRFYDEQKDMRGDQFKILRKAFLMDAIAGGCSDKGIHFFENHTQPPSYGKGYTYQTTEDNLKRTKRSLSGDGKTFTCEELQKSSSGPTILDYCLNCPMDPRKWHHPSKGDWWVSNQGFSIDAYYNGRMLTYKDVEVFSPKKHQEFVFGQTGMLLTIKDETWKTNYLPKIMSVCTKHFQEGVSEEEIGCERIIKKMQATQPDPKSKDVLIKDSEYHMASYLDAESGAVWIRGTTLERECRKVGVDIRRFGAHCQRNGYLYQNGSSRHKVKVTNYKKRRLRLWQFKYADLWGDGWEPEEEALSFDESDDDDKKPSDEEVSEALQWELGDISTDQLTFKEYRAVEQTLGKLADNHPSGIPYDDIVKAVNMSPERVSQALERLQGEPGITLYKIQDDVWRFAKS